MHDNTQIWNGNIKFHTFEADTWYGIDGPNHPLFKELHSRILNEVPYLDEFQLYAIGGVLEDWVSWDIDLALIGEYQPIKIREIFEEIMRISFDMNLYVDVHYQDRLWRVDKMTSDNLMEENIECWHLANSFTKNGHTDFYDKYVLVDGLYKTTMKYPFPKHVEKIKSGYRYNPPLLLN